VTGPLAYVARRYGGSALVYGIWNQLERRWHDPCVPPVTDPARVHREWRLSRKGAEHVAAQLNQAAAGQEMTESRLSQ
jgi:hypothetical protein